VADLTLRWVDRFPLSLKIWGQVEFCHDGCQVMVDQALYSWPLHTNPEAPGLPQDLSTSKEGESGAWQGGLPQSWNVQSLHLLPLLVWVITGKALLWGEGSAWEMGRLEFWFCYLKELCELSQRKLCEPSRVSDSSSVKWK
jgi:hypothetical protein